MVALLLTDPDCCGQSQGTPHQESGSSEYLLRSIDLCPKIKGRKKKS